MSTLTGLMLQHAIGRPPLQQPVQRRPEPMDQFPPVEALPAAAAPRSASI